MSHKSPKFASAGPGTATGPQLPVAGKPLPPQPIDIGRVEQQSITFENLSLIHI